MKPIKMNMPELPEDFDLNKWNELTVQAIAEAMKVPTAYFEPRPCHWKWESPKKDPIQHSSWVIKDTLRHCPDCKKHGVG